MDPNPVLCVPRRPWNTWWQQQEAEGNVRPFVGRVVGIQQAVVSLGVLR